MKLFDRLGKGWNLGIKSLEVIAEHPKLLLFPIMSSIGMIAVLLSFATAFLGVAGFNPEFIEVTANNLADYGEFALYTGIFIFYLITYFLIVFFNVGLVHNARLIFAGEQPSIREGLRFATERAHTIFAWAALAATVGLILQAIEERLGSLVSGVLGFAWSLATYFVVPTLAAEEVGPIDALKRSANTIKEKWGESIGAGFSLGLFNLAGIALALIAGFSFGILIHPGIGVLVGFITFALTLVVNSAARNIFLAAAYEHTQGNTPAVFDSETLDSVFMRK